MQRTGLFDLEVLEDGYVAGPVSFHDAEVEAFSQSANSASVRLKIPEESSGNCIVLIKCIGLRYVYYSTGWFQNVTLGLWKFDRIWDERFRLSLSGGAKAEAERVMSILNSTTSFVANAKSGIALWFEPCAENELLVLCDEVTSEFVSQS